MDTVQSEQPLPEPGRHEKIHLCDRRELEGGVQPDTEAHALGHCVSGQHCFWVTASCSAEMAQDNHPPRCCTCKNPI